MKIKLVSLVCLVVSLVSSCLSQDRSPDEVIKVKTNLVSVPVIVSDHDGRYIPDLRQEDFVLTQDGVSQKIEFFAPTEEPINIAVLIDTSGSTSDVIKDIKKAASDFITLLEPDDRAMILNFDDNLHVLSPLTSDHGQLTEAIRQAHISFFGSTALRDAVLQTIQVQFKGVEGRKAIILLTDGKDNESRISTQRLLDTVSESDVIVYPVDFKTVSSSLRNNGLFGMPDPFRRRNVPIFHEPKPPKTYWPPTSKPTKTTRPPVWTTKPPKTTKPPGTRPPKPPKTTPSRTSKPPTHHFTSEPIYWWDMPIDNEEIEAWNFLNRLANVTGGRMYDGKAAKFYVFEFIVEELRRQYRIGYYPPEESENETVHSIKVQVLRPDVAVRARSTYRPAPK